MHRRTPHTVIALAIGLTTASCASVATDSDTATIGETSPGTTSTVATLAAPTTAPTPDSSPATSITTASGADVEVTERCNEPPESIVRATLMDLVTTGAATPCMSAGAQAHVSALRGAYFTFDVESTATRFENPVLGTSGWSVGVALDLSDDDGETNRVIQQWTLVDTGDHLIIDAIEYLDTDAVVAQAETTVSAYLGHIAAGRFDEAAALLGEGGQSWDGRFDLTALPELPATGPELAASLERWCDIGATCEEPSTISGRPNIRGGSAEVTAVWDIGGQRTTATFDAGTYEGAPEVTGLPPLTDVNNAAAIDVIAKATDASIVVIETADGHVVASVDGRLAVIPVPVDSFAWSDGAFVYWQTSEADEAGQYVTTSTVADFSGNIVCEALGTIHLVRRLAGGSYVASVERDAEATPTSAEYPVPNYAVDCATGLAEPIASRSFHGEGSGRSLVTINGTTFTFNYDAEGNGDILNEAGDSINGDDYAGFHAFAPDAMTVAYGDYGKSFSPHVTTTIRVRDTSTTALLWSVELPRVFSSLAVTASRLAIGLPAENAQHEPWSAQEVIRVYDLATGNRLVDLATSAQILYAS